MSTKRLQLLTLISSFYISFALLRHYFAPLDLLPALILMSLLVWVTIVDLERFEIPDLASVLLAISGLAMHWPSENGLIINRLASGFLWAALFWLVGEIYLRVKGLDGLGFGDVKLMIGLGIWLGFGGTALVVFAAALSGIFSILVLHARTGKHLSPIAKSKVAFGPFLCLSAWVVWLLRDIV